MAAEPAAIVDYGAFERWADRHLPQLGNGPLETQILAGGASNIVLRIDRRGTPMVLRRPPRVPRPDSAKIIGREARVLAALNGSDVPHPHLHAYCNDPAVIGAPFYVMALVDGFLGHPFSDLPAPYDQPGEPRRNLAFALVEGIARLANIDYRAVGLEGFGKPDGFLERQVERWLSQLDSYAASEGHTPRAIPGLEAVAEWLKANAPGMSPAGIIHGDYSFANAMFHFGPEPRLAAMIDWELATIGDPLLDLGWVLYAFNGRDERMPPAGYFDPAGFPYREELAEHYAGLTGRSVENLTYYMVLAQFKLAVIMERHYARMLNGRQTRELGEVSGAFVLRLIAKAEAMTRGAA